MQNPLTYLLLLVVYIGLSSCVGTQRKMLFYPSQRAHAIGDLDQWKAGDGSVIGVKREVSEPKAVWLMLHGNGGQAADRKYALGSFSEQDAVYVLEYPGYGMREGKRSKKAFNAAAAEAYLQLRKTYPNQKIGLVGESIGSGVACSLASQSQAPDKIVLITPYDRLSKVANDHVPLIPFSLIMADNWNNGKALAGYKGPVDIFAAKSDRVIYPKHAQSLAEKVTGAKLTLIEGGHNDWNQGGKVKVRMGIP